LSYDDFFKSELGREVMEREASFMVSHLNGLLASIGCGTGIIEKKAMEMKDVEIIGVEKDIKMVEIAKRRMEVIRGDASHLPFKDSSLDGVAFITSLEFVDDYTSALEEAKRVLKKEGKMVAIMLNTSSNYFKRSYEKGGYIRRHIKNVDVEEIERSMKKIFHVRREALFGIEGGKIVEEGDAVYGYIATMR